MYTLTLTQVLREISYGSVPRLSWSHLSLSKSSLSSGPSSAVMHTENATAKFDSSSSFPRAAASELNPWALEWVREQKFPVGVLMVDYPEFSHSTASGEKSTELIHAVTMRNFHAPVASSSLSSTTAASVLRTFAERIVANSTFQNGSFAFASLAELRNQLCDAGYPFEEVQEAKTNFGRQLDNFTSADLDLWMLELCVAMIVVAVGVVVVFFVLRGRRIRLAGGEFGAEERHENRQDVL